MSHIANRLAAVKPSASMAVSQAAKDLAATGVDVIDLGLGGPDFVAPDHVTEAAHRAATVGRMLYTASLGTPDLRKAVAAKFRREHGLDYAIDEIAVANGAKQIVFNALMAPVEEVVELILPAATSSPSTGDCLRPLAVLRHFHGHVGRGTHRCHCPDWTGRAKIRTPRLRQ